MFDGDQKRWRPVANSPDHRSADTKNLTQPRSGTLKLPIWMLRTTWDALAKAAEGRGMTSQAYIRWVLNRELGLSAALPPVDDRSGVRPSKRHAFHGATRKGVGTSKG